MKHMHDKNIYHRKLEPSNIMLTEDGMVLVGDLGATTDADR
jgi:serine/threonine protein kinase